MSSKNTLEFEESKDVFVAWTNTDRTEGRGKRVPHAVAEIRETAERLGEGAHVQGTDCPVTKETAYKVEDGVMSYWLVPGKIMQPTEEDKERAEARAAEEKARELGMSEEDIQKLKNNS